MKCIIENCNSTKIHASSMCVKHWRKSRYGMCLNGCSQPASQKNGLCTNCKNRGGLAPSRRNSGLCSKCSSILVKNRCPNCRSVSKKDWSLRSRYGISLHEWKDILFLQDNKCKICGLFSEKMCVDHDHACCSGRKTCGKCIRGLICDRCNKVLGLIKDSDVLLDQLKDYLKEVK